jgi:hypothetical protein
MEARHLLPREVYVLGLVAFCVAVGFGVLVPVLPVFARSFGVGNAQVGAVISAFALMRLISSPFCGWLIKILSERIIMATGIFIVAISSGLAGLSGSYLQLLVLRGVGGIGSAMFTVSAFTLLLTSVEAGYAVARLASFRPGFSSVGLPGLLSAARYQPSRSPPRSSSTPGHSSSLEPRDWCCSADAVRSPMSRPPRPCRYAWWYATPVIRRHASATSPKAGPRSESGRH